MSGERSVRFINLAEQAAQRMHRKIAMVSDRYGPPPKDDDVITLIEMERHYDDYGHMPGHPDCGHPICERARMMVAGAIQAMMQQGGQ